MRELTFDNTDHPSILNPKRLVFKIFCLCLTNIPIWVSAGEGLTLNLMNMAGDRLECHTISNPIQDIGMTGLRFYDVSGELLWERALFGDSQVQSLTHLDTEVWVTGLYESHLELDGIYRQGQDGLTAFFAAFHAENGALLHWGTVAANGLSRAGLNLREGRPVLVGRSNEGGFRLPIHPDSSPNGMHQRLDRNGMPQFGWAAKTDEIEETDDNDVEDTQGSTVPPSGPPNLN